MSSRRPGANAEVKRLFDAGGQERPRTQRLRRLAVFDDYCALSPDAQNRVRALIASLRRLERTAR